MAGFPTAQQFIGAYATALDTYYDAETKFRRSPSADTLDDYHRAHDRLVVLRREITHSVQFSDALFPCNDFIAE